VVSWVQIPLSLLSKVEAVDASTFFARVAMSEAIQSLQPAHIGGKYDAFTGRII
jgi:hypothetical protein